MDSNPVAASASTSTATPWRLTSSMRTAIWELAMQVVGQMRHDTRRGDARCRSGFDATSLSKARSAPPKMSGRRERLDGGPGATPPTLTLARPGQIPCSRRSGAPSLDRCAHNLVGAEQQSDKDVPAQSKAEQARAARAVRSFERETGHRLLVPVE